MVDENVKKKDLELILEVNKKAIEIEAEVIDQNEAIIEALNQITKTNENIIDNTDKIIKTHEEVLKEIKIIDRNLFKIQILYISGLLALIGQIIQLFMKK